MVDVTRKHVAPQHRVLVNAKAFLNPEFADGVLFFTGGQIELLRNLMQYANRRSTWVSDYYIGYYLSPSDADWNLIQQRVADLEEVLMGNNNVIWGYKEAYSEVKTSITLPAGIDYIYSATPPEGELYRIHNLAFVVGSATCTRAQFYGFIDGRHILFTEQLTPVTMQLYPYSKDIIVQEGGYMYLKLYGLTLNDDVWVYWSGYKMDVPAL